MKPKIVPPLMSGDECIALLEKALFSDDEKERAEGRAALKARMAEIRKDQGFTEHSGN